MTPAIETTPTLDQLYEMILEFRKRLELLEQKTKEIKPRLHFFHQSKFFDKEYFKKATPKWSEEERAYWYDAAFNYSNKGNRYINWLQAIEKWKKTEDKKNGVMDERPRVTKF